MTDADTGPTPRTRVQQQRATRRALIDAAREVFARDGYHGANLSRIAKHAGFSKGAVYSNFEHKAALFLAVMDRDLLALRGSGWDPLEPYEYRDHSELVDLDAMRGFALATLEFIATAVRDEELNAALLDRIELLLGAYERVVSSGRSDDDHLDDRQLAALLTALDQGVALLAVSGIVAVDGSMLRIGLRRLLRPSPDEPHGDEESGPSALRSLAEHQTELLESRHTTERADAPDS